MEGGKEMGKFLILWNDALIVIDSEGYVLTPGGGMGVGEQITEYRCHEGIELEHLQLDGIPATRWEDK